MPSAAHERGYLVTYKPRSELCTASQCMRPNYHTIHKTNDFGVSFITLAMTMEVAALFANAEYV